jgi:hypothetical protein
MYLILIANKTNKQTKSADGKEISLSVSGNQRFTDSVMLRAATTKSELLLLQ